MIEEYRFPIYIIASFLIYGLIIRIALRQIRSDQNRKIFLSGLVVVVVGMLIGKYGHNFGLPWWIYYPIPALMTLIIPAVYFKMIRKETLIYILLSFCSAPLIHFFFSFFIGWNDYLPFIAIKPFWEVI